MISINRYDKYRSRNPDFESSGVQLSSLDRTVLVSSISIQSAPVSVKLGGVNGQIVSI